MIEWRCVGTRIIVGMNEQILKDKLNRPLRYYAQVDSTQDLALAWLRDGAEAGSIIIGDEQLKGRGRHGRLWHTPPGVALAISVVLKPPVDAMHQVTMLGALSIAEMIEKAAASYGVDPARYAVSIKWPNDVRINGRKVSGVLPEAAWDGNHLVGVALGMGVNVRVEFADALRDTAISIEPALDTSVDRVDLIAWLLERIDYWSNQWGSERLFKTWRDRLDTLGQDVTINGIHGRATSVTPQGALLIRDVDGQQHTVIAGDLIE